MTVVVILHPILLSVLLVKGTCILQKEWRSMTGGHEVRKRQEISYDQKRSWKKWKSNMKRNETNIWVTSRKYIISRKKNSQKDLETQKIRKESRQLHKKLKSWRAVTKTRKLYRFDIWRKPETRKKESKLIRDRIKNTECTLSDPKKVLSGLEQTILESRQKNESIEQISQILHMSKNTQTKKKVWEEEDEDEHMIE